MRARIAFAYLLLSSLVHAFLPSPSLCGIRRPSLEGVRTKLRNGEQCRHGFGASRHSRRLSLLPRARKPQLSSLSASDATPPDLYDVVIIGSGPASLSLATLLTSTDPSSAPSVAVCSKDIQKEWVPNYGVWVSEWQTLDDMFQARNVRGLMDAGVDMRWEDTDCFFGEDMAGNPTSNPEGNERRSLNRPYIRVSRSGLKSVFYNDDSKFKTIEENVVGEAIGTNIFTPADAVTFHETHTTLTLTDGSKVSGKVVIDGTGGESRFTIRDDREKEGYQIAYGVECTVKGPGLKQDFVGDYDKKKMTLFDYRSEGWRDTLPDPNKVVKQPTFNYVMPLGDDRFFFEETSLVAAPALRFEECRARLDARLAAQGLTIDQVFDREFCYIPMGGGVPRRGQRVVPVGAAAGVVHASTGYQICRCLASNCHVSDAVLAELAQARGGNLKEAAGGFDADGASARVVGRTWTPEAVRQRDFTVFGGEFLMAMDVDGLKGFFSGFFKLDEPDWAGFLAGWEGLPGNERHQSWSARITFGLRFLTKLPLAISAAMAVAVVRYTLAEGTPLLRSVTPLFGAPQPFDTDRRFRSARAGDVTAKEEAWRMMGVDPNAPESKGAAKEEEEKEEVVEKKEEKQEAEEGAAAA